MVFKEKAVEKAGVPVEAWAIGRAAGVSGGARAIGRSAGVTGGAWAIGRAAGVTGGAWTIGTAAGVTGGAWTIGTAAWVTGGAWATGRGSSWMALERVSESDFRFAIEGPLEYPSIDNRLHPSITQCGFTSCTDAMICVSHRQFRFVGNLWHEFGNCIFSNRNVVVPRGTQFPCICFGSLE